MTYREGTRRIGDNVMGPFALGTFGFPGDASFPGLLTDSKVLDLRFVPELWDTVADLPSIRGLLEAWETSLRLLTAVVARRTRYHWYDVDDLRVYPPVQPRQIFQADGDAVAQLVEPRLIAGLLSALTGPYDDVVIPGWAQRLDWEVELAAVVGRTALEVSPRDALDHVAGYTIADDLTARDSNWLRGKNFPGFTPLGPYLVPAGFVGDPDRLRLTVRLNGRTLPAVATESGCRAIADLLSFASHLTRLLPGDLVLTGGRSGNGARWGHRLEPGDTIDIETSGLGRQHTRFLRARRSVHHPKYSESMDGRVMQDREAVETYYEAWTKLNGDLANVPLADDVVFISPVASLRGRDQLQAMAAQFGPVAADFRVREQFFAEDGTVLSVVEWELPGVEGTTSAAEILTVTDGVIAKAELFYDPRLVIEFTTANQ